MTIQRASEIQHPCLGPIRFEDGSADPEVAGSQISDRMWVCRPDGWMTDFEIYLPGDELGPQNLAAGEKALRARDRIETEGKSIAGQNVELGWIDLTRTPPEVAYPSLKDPYEIWKGILGDGWEVIDLSEETW